MVKRARSGMVNRIVWLWLACLLAACAPGGPDPTLTLPTATAAASPTPPPAPTPTPPPAAAFQNPVIDVDFPDPFILRVGDQYYAYATNSAGRNIQAAVSADLQEWRLLEDAMPELPPWAMPGGMNVWAPEVLQVQDGFLLYYTARDRASGKQCVGVAFSPRPEGSFTDSRGAPLVCQAKLGGTIDPSPFRDGDRLYLLFKNDGNCCGLTAWLWVQEMTSDGQGLVGDPVKLASNDRPWEGRVVEAPTLVKHEDRYYLFYSANNYSGPEYAVGYALCESVSGPCQDAPENPILKSNRNNPAITGPGHQTLLRVEDRWWIIFHAWEPGARGIKTSRRQLWIEPLTWRDGKPVVEIAESGTLPKGEKP